VTESSERKFSKCSDNGHPKEATIFQKNCNCTWLKFDLLLPIVLPALAVGHALMFTLYNSQGYTHDGYQIVVFRGAMPGASALPRRAAWHPDRRGLGCSFELFCAAGFGADVNASTCLSHWFDQFA
jgi:hypothetical protein